MWWEPVCWVTPRGSVKWQMQAVPPGCAATSSGSRSDWCGGACGGSTSARSAIEVDELVVATGAQPAHAGIAGLDHLGPADGVDLIHSMGDALALDQDLDRRRPASAVIVGAG